MAVTGWKASGTAATVDRDGEVEWTDPNNAKTDDSNFAFCMVNKTIYGDWLRLTNFGFSTSDIPADAASIDGIEVQYKRAADTVDVISDSAIYLRKSTGQTGDNEASAVKWASSKETVTYGGAADMWGTSLTGADIRASTFGIDLSAANSDGDSIRRAEIYFCQIRVYYTTGIFEVSITDGFKGGDTPTRAMIAGLSVTDGLTGGDSNAPYGMLSSTDGVKIGDTTLRDVLMSLAVSDGTKLGDTPLREMIAGLSASDGLKIGDIPSLLAMLIATDGLKVGDTPLILADLLATDGFKMGDTLATLLVLLAIADSIKIGDTPVLSSHVQASDGIVVGDSTSQEMLVYFLLTDGGKFGDTKLIELIEEAIQLAVTDGIKIGDAVTTAMGLAIADGIKVGDTPALAMVATLSILEGIKLGDTTYTSELARLLKAWIFTEPYHDAKVYTEPYHEATIFTEPYHYVTIWTGEEDMTIRRDWQRPETVPIWAEVKVDGILANPTESILLTLTNKSGTVVVDGLAMDNVSTGLYVYYWNSAADSVVGWYKAKGHFQDGTGDNAKITIEYGGFSLQ